jgi:EAL domain-containing protein (putative c-di-GMP-specific phosphodiesterase class I)
VRSTSARIGLAHELAIEVVAEGVETTSQRDFLIAAGCKVAQGYYFGRHGNRTHTARLLDISLRSLRIKLHDYAQSGCAVCEPNAHLDQFLCEQAKSPLAPCRRH